MRRLALAIVGVPTVAIAVAIGAAIAGAGDQACTSSQGAPAGGVPAQLVPLFQGAPRQYNLGPTGAAILAAINYQESDFDQSKLPGVHAGANSAGAAGPMQIGIGGDAGDTWDLVKVNAPGDPPGQPPNVYNEPDAVYSAAHYLALSGLTPDPATWQGAIWSYNHADSYVSAVLERAHIYYAQGLRTSNSAVFVGSATPASCPVTSPGSYVNPFARVPPGHLVAERIDMGVDYADNSPDPILAIGAATISYAGPDPGWENGYSVNYRLTDGPLRGRYVYVAETITPTVRTGEHVIAGAPIAAFAEPNVHGLETGWAAGPGRPAPKAAALGQQSRSGDPGGSLTWCGNNMSDLLSQLGAPGGRSEGRSVVGSGC